MDDEQYEIAVEEAKDEVGLEGEEWIDEAIRLSMQQDPEQQAVTNIIDSVPTRFPIYETTNTHLGPIMGANETELSANWFESNKEYRDRHKDTVETLISITTAYGMNFVYAKYADGQEQLDVINCLDPAPTSYSDLDIAAMVENMGRGRKPTAVHLDNIEPGSYVPRDEMLGMMAQHINEALDSGTLSGGNAQL